MKEEIILANPLAKPSTRRRKISFTFIVEIEVEEDFIKYLTTEEVTFCKEDLQKAYKVFLKDVKVKE